MRTILTLLLGVSVQFAFGQDEPETCSSSNCQPAASCWEGNRNGLQARQDCVLRCLDSNGASACASTMRTKQAQNPPPADQEQKLQCMKREICTAENIQVAADRAAKREAGGKGRKGGKGKGKKGKGKKGRQGRKGRKGKKGGKCGGSGAPILRMLKKVPSGNTGAEALKTCLEGCNTCQDCSQTCSLRPLVLSAGKKCRNGEKGGEKRERFSKEDRKSLCECVVRGVGGSTDGDICEQRGGQRGKGKGKGKKGKGNKGKGKKGKGKENRGSG